MPGAEAEGSGRWLSSRAHDGSSGTGFTPSLDFEGAQAETLTVAHAYAPRQAEVRLRDTCRRPPTQGEAQADALACCPS